MPSVKSDQQANHATNLRGRRRAPVPTGPLSGKRSPLRRFLSRALARVNEALDVLPPGRWLHRRVQRNTHFSQVDIELRRGGAGLEGMRIAFLSDVHCGSFMNESDLCRMFERVAAQEPDMICFGGDLVNTRERQVLMLRKPLGLVKPPLGIYAVPGNHDHFFGRDIGLWEAFLREQGVHVLINRGMRVERDGSPLWVAGVDDLTEAEPDLARAMYGADPDDPVLLLSHHPDFFVEAIDANIDLQLSGHTHGGQIVFGGWTPLKHSEFGYWRGLFERELSQLYVSRGVGVTVLPLRIGASAEVPVINLRTPRVEG
ncbi:MAG: metallophosphoesterase [Planctomycetes bacterium]|nr:metallophosphoesterase [Planctomycetota bacterium]